MAQQMVPDGQTQKRRFAHTNAGVYKSHPANGGGNLVDLFTPLPLELKREICEYLCDHCKTTIPQHETFKPRHGPLASLCLASRALRDAAEPVLYHFFFCQDSEPQQRLEPFSKTLLQRPELAAHIRRIRYRPEPWSQDADWREVKRGAFLETNSEIENLTLHRSLFDMVLSRAENLEELSIEIEEGWCMPPIDLPQLKDLHLQRPKEWMPPSLTYPKGERGLNAAPLLERLWLEKWNLFDVAHHDVLDLISHIRRLSIQPDTKSHGSPENRIKILVKEIPKLTGFDWFDPHLGTDPEVELLSHLLVRKSELTEIYIESDFFFIDFTLLSHFENLKDLRLHCHIQDLFETDNYEEKLSKLKEYRLALPYSLEKLEVFIVDQLHMWILVRLSQSLSQYVNLKAVECISGLDAEGRELRQQTYRILKEERVQENFLKANVDFSVSELDHERIRSLVEYISWDSDYEYYEDY
ncbi:hypothetical protein EDB80DRAFT_779645 [Ilyonectria destructans]|nr:hypothetical protein EDB80DRAFT_779645 [Ilyonectria destructans]